MPSLNPRGGALASSADGRRLVWAEPGRLALLDVVERSLIAEAEAELDAPLELAISGAKPERLLALQAKGGGTLVRLYTLPELGPVVNARIKGEFRIVAICGAIAVLQSGSETLVAVDLTELRTATLPVRGPIQLVAQASPEQILVGARGKLEAWRLDERRPTHRVNLPVPGDAAFGGPLAGGRMFWFATAGGIVSWHRLSDGKHVGELSVEGRLLAIQGDPASTTAVAAVDKPGTGGVQLLALDLETRTIRPLAADRAVAAFCLAGSGFGLVAALGESGEPVLLPLSSVTGTAQPAIDATRPPATEQPVAAPASEIAEPEPAPAESREIGGSDLGARLTQWREQLRAAMHAAPPRQLQHDERIRFSGEPASRSRAELYAWGLSARARTTTTPPPPPQGWRINDLVSRFRLDTRARTLLSLVYASWLDGDGRSGLPVGTIARALGNDEAAWIEALAQGRLGTLGWLRSSFGRTRLHPVVGSFLDEAPPCVELVEPRLETARTVAPPAVPAVLELSDGLALDELASELASWLGAPIALIDVGALPAPGRGRRCLDRVLEARLHGALPILFGARPDDVDLRHFDDATLLAIRGPRPEAWSTLPTWPPPPPADADDRPTATAQPPTDGEPHPETPTAQHG
jgi:hypothetical protein